MRYRAKPQLRAGAGHAGGGGFSRQPSYPMRADFDKGVNPSGRDEKLEKVMQNDAF